MDAVSGSLSSFIELGASQDFPVSTILLHDLPTQKSGHLIAMTRTTAEEMKSMKVIDGNLALAECGIDCPWPWSALLQQPVLCHSF